MESRKNENGFLSAKYRFAMWLVFVFTAVVLASVSLFAAEEHN